jgi:transposase
MLNPDIRKAVFALFEQGMGKREISRRMQISRNTVKKIISEKGKISLITRKDSINIEDKLLLKVYKECDGWIQRMHEIITERENIKIGYSTLTRMLRERGLGKSKKIRCDKVADVPGEEMQHDTTIYYQKIGDKRIKVIASVLYLRYSKVRYLKLYRTFNRFKMKCFLHEALTHFGYSASTCIIDNTNLARLRGAGKNAVIAPEMEQFAKSYGFRFICHAIGHANRKAGNERSFYTIETNFLPGRKFKTLDDMNKQAFDWATVRMRNRKVSGTGLLPAKALEYEQSYLNKLTPFIPAPYQEHKRITDQYGYAAFNGNFYVVPKNGKFEVTILEYSESIKIYHKREALIEYQLPSSHITNRIFSPEGYPKLNRKPNNIKKQTQKEEQKLRSLSEETDRWLTLALKDKGTQKHNFIISVYNLYKKLSPTLFLKTIKRALKYGVIESQKLENIATLIMTNEGFVLPETLPDPKFQSRDSYIEGRFSEDADLAFYDSLIENYENE